MHQNTLPIATRPLPVAAYPVAGRVIGPRSDADLPDATRLIATPQIATPPVATQRSTTQRSATQRSATRRSATRPATTQAPASTRARRSTIAQHPFLTFVTVAYLGVVGLVTLGPQPGGALFRTLANAVMELVWRVAPTSGFDYSDLEFSTNVAMFVPVGVLFVLLFGPRYWLLAIAAGVMLTMGIEAAQAFLPGRVSDPRDLLANGAGAVLGSLIGVALTARRKR